MPVWGTPSLSEAQAGGGFPPVGAPCDDDETVLPQNIKEMVRRKESAVVGAVRDQVDFLKRASRQNAWGIKVKKRSKKSSIFLSLCRTAAVTAAVSFGIEDVLPMFTRFQVRAARATI